MEPFNSQTATDHDSANAEPEDGDEKHWPHLLSALSSLAKSELGVVFVFYSAV